MIAGVDNQASLTNQRMNMRNIIITTSLQFRPLARDKRIRRGRKEKKKKKNIMYANSMYIFMENH